MLSALLKRLAGGKRARSEFTLAGAREAYAAHRFAPALEILQVLLRHNPDSEDAHALAGACRLEQARETQIAASRARAAAPDVSRLYREAAAHFERSAELSPAPCAARRRQAVALREAGNLAASHAALGLLSCSDDVEYQLELALDALCHSDVPRALTTYERALGRWPADPRVHAAYALALLGEGDFARGWDEYEWRLRLPEFSAARALPFPVWRGEPLEGRTLLLEPEQGLGDQIMFASCVPDLLAAGARLVIEASPRLRRLFEHSFPEAIVVPKSRAGHDWNRLPKIDWRVPVGSLPRYFRRERHAFGGQAYLQAPPDLVAHYRGRLAALGPGRKIGLAWRGGLPGTMRALRSLDFAQLRPLLEMEGMQFVSLELGDCRAEIDAARAGARIAWWPEAAYDMAHLAALVTALDGAACVATTAVHVAGALGQRACALVASGATWRYMWRGEAMPWYASVKVLRPARPGDWSAALQRLCRELKCPAA